MRENLYAFLNSTPPVATLIGSLATITYMGLLIAILVKTVYLRPQASWLVVPAVVYFLSFAYNSMTVVDEIADNYNAFSVFFWDSGVSVATAIRVSAIAVMLYGINRFYPPRIVKIQEPT